MSLDSDSIGVFVALGGTFQTHLDEKARTYRWPDLWVVPSRSVINEGEPIRIPERVDSVKPGAELTAVIGEPLSNATEEEAWDAVKGFTVSNDVTASGDWPGWSDPDHPMITGVGYKLFPTFTSILSEYVPKDDEETYYDLDVEITVDGEPCVSGSTRDLAFSIPELIAHASSIIDLREDDVVALGDPGNPTTYLDDGSSVTCTIESVGELTNPITSA